MGHYLSEMYSPFQDDKLRVEYKRSCVAEIDELVANNPLRVGELALDDKLVLYRELRKPSEVSITPAYTSSSRVLHNIHFHPLWGESHVRAARLHALKGFFRVNELFVDEKQVRIAPKTTGWVSAFHNLVKPVGFFERYSEEYDMKKLRW